MPEVAAEIIHPNSSGGGALGTSDLPWGAIYAVQLYKGGAAVATLASPAFTGTPTAPTVAGTADSTTKIATTAFVQACLAALTFAEEAALTAHTGDSTIHLTAEQIRDLIATFAVGGDTLSVTHDDGANTLTFAVKLKEPESGEGEIRSTSDGLYVLMGTTATRAAAGNDSRFPTANEKSSLRVHNFSASAAPTVNDDTGDGYGIGSIWINTLLDKVYMAVDVTSGAAVWEQLNTSVSVVELDSALADALQTSATIAVSHDTEADTFSFAVVPKASSLTSNEGRISATGTGVVAVLGTTANTACAGDDERLRQHNFTAIAAPTADDDESLGYQVGSIWVDTSAGAVYICTDPTAEAAVWTSTGAPVLTASRAVVTNGSGALAAATTTSAEIGYVNGVTSAIQTQLDAKAATTRKLDDFGAPDDNTDLDVSTTAHGLCPKISGSDGYVLTKSGTASVWAAGGSGTIGGSTGATDNRLLRADGTGGATAQSSAVTVDDSGNMSGVGTLGVSGAATFSNTVGVGALTCNSTLTSTASTSQLAALLINAQTGTSYTLVLTDAGKVVTCSNASAVALTVPPNADVAFLVGTFIPILSLNTGVVTITPGSGVTINQPASRTLALTEQYSAAGILKIATNTWQAFGDLAAV